MVEQNLDKATLGQTAEELAKSEEKRLDEIREELGDQKWATEVGKSVLLYSPLIHEEWAKPTLRILSAMITDIRFNPDLAVAYVRGQSWVIEDVMFGRGESKRPQPVLVRERVDVAQQEL